MAIPYKLFPLDRAVQLAFKLEALVDLKILSTTQWTGNISLPVSESPTTAQHSLDYSKEFLDMRFRQVDWSPDFQVTLESDVILVTYQLTPTVFEPLGG